MIVRLAVIGFLHVTVHCSESKHYNKQDQYEHKQSQKTLQLHSLSDAEILGMRVKGTEIRSEKKRLRYQNVISDFGNSQFRASIWMEKTH